jgi:putative endonuclease
MRDGRVADRAGRAAEASVARHYERSGRPIAAARWHSAAGEIDLIAREGAAVIFIEVKHSRTHAEAVEQLSARQQARILASAAAYLAGEPDGQATLARFDVALVDRAGRIEIIENALAA